MKAPKLYRSVPSVFVVLAMLMVGALPGIAMPTMLPGNVVGLALTNKTAARAAGDPETGNNSVQVHTLQQQPNIRIVKTGPATVMAGGSATYTVTLSNIGTGLALNVVISDTIYAGGVGIPLGSTTLPVVPPGFSQAASQTLPIPVEYAGLTMTNVVEAVVEGDSDPSDNISQIQTFVYLRQTFLPILIR